MSADPGERRAQQVSDQIVQPVLVRPAVRVGEGDDLAGGRLDAGVPGHAKPLVPDVTQASDPGKGRRDGGGGVGGAVVHQDHLVVRVVEPVEGFEAGLQRGGAVVARHHHRDPGRPGQGKPGCDGETLTDHLEGLLRGPVGAGQSEGPVLDQAAVVPPLVAEGINHHPGAAGAEGALDLPSEDLRLDGLALPDGVHAELPKHQRLGVRQHLEPGEVVLERLPLVQVDVVTEEIDRFRPEELGGGEIAESAEELGVLGFRGRHKAVDEGLDRRGPAPADDVGGDLVHHAQCEHGGMRGADAGRFADDLDGVVPGLLRIQEAQVPVPRDVEQEAQVVLVGQVEEPPRRNVVDPQQVGPERADPLEISKGGFRGGEGDAVRPWRERTVGHPLGMELPPVETEEFPVHGDAGARIGRFGIQGPAKGGGRTGGVDNGVVGGRTEVPSGRRPER